MVLINGGVIYFKRGLFNVNIHHTPCLDLLYHIVMEQVTSPERYTDADSVIQQKKSPPSP